MLRLEGLGKLKNMNDLNGKRAFRFRPIFLRWGYPCDVSRRLRKNVRRLRPELWLQGNWLLHHGNAPSHTSFFTREFLTKNNMTVILHPPYFFLFPRLKIELKAAILTQLR
jgi:hypothetical protein